MTRIQKRIDSFLYDTGGYSTQRIAVHGGEGLYRTEHTPDDKPIQVCQKLANLKKRQNLTTREKK